MNLTDYTISTPEPVMNGTLFMGEWEVMVYDDIYACDFALHDLGRYEECKQEILDQGIAEIKKMRNRLH